MMCLPTFGSGGVAGVETLESLRYYICTNVFSFNRPTVPS
jgi:hypothetical protein